MKPISMEFTKIDGNTTSHSMSGIKATAHTRVEQDVDLVLKSSKLKIFSQAHNEVLLTTDRRFKHYKLNEDGIIAKDGPLFTKHYGRTGSVKYYQNLKQKLLDVEVLGSVDGEFRMHRGITETIFAYRQKYYCPNMA